MAEDGGKCECGFEGLKGVLLGFAPFELLIFLGEEGKGLDNVGEVFDESTVIISKPHESLYIAVFLGHRPFHNSVNLFEVHL